MRLNKIPDSSIRRTLSRLLVTAAMPLAIWGCDSNTGAIDSAAPSIPADTGLSAVVAIRVDGGGSVADFIKDKVAAINTAADLNYDGDLPLPNTLSDTTAKDEDGNYTGINDDFIVVDGLAYNVVAKQYDPLTSDTSLTAPRFGANNDFTAYVGDGVDLAAGDNPIWAGDATKGWMWINFEYISGQYPTSSKAPTSQALVFANWLNAWNLFTTATVQNLLDVKAWATATDRDEYIRQAKLQHGGAWMRVTKGTDGVWSVDTAAANLRFDGTSKSLFRVTGYTPSSTAIKDDGGVKALDKLVIPGTLGNCSGNLTPWGTIISGEENAQDFWGDADAWSSNEKFTAGKGFDITADIAPVWAATSSSNFGQLSVSAGKQNIDYYGFLTEIDPGVAPDQFYKPLNGDGDPTDDPDTAEIEGDGTGHRKLGAMGRARWENATFAVDGDFELVDGQPIVMYGGDDRTNGRMYKFVSSGTYSSGMSKAEIRKLLDSGSVYVAHFSSLNWNGDSSTASGNATCKRLEASSGYKIVGENGAGSGDGCGGDSNDAARVPTKTDRGVGRWIKLDVGNATDVAPASAYWDNTKTSLGITASNTKVGAALKSNVFNLIGGFPKNNAVLSILHTAATKIGATQLNRVEDMEYNPLPLDNANPLIYFSLTKHTAKYSLDQRSAIITGTTQDLLTARSDKNGRIWVIEETGNPSNPGSSLDFTYWEVWAGGNDYSNRYVGGNPDNILVDADGGVWFGTDGYFGLTQGSDATHIAHDAFYYLDTEDAHATTYQKAFRVASMPNDAENTGPSFNSDMTALFMSVQHPGEDLPGSWPQADVPGNVSR